MSDRDPRMDPRPGDVLRMTTTVRRVTTERRVLSRTSRMVICHDGAFTLKTQLKLWREWAATAEVLALSGAQGDQK